MGEQLQNVAKLGPLDRVMSMIPGLPQGMLPQGMEKEGGERMKRMMILMDSMTDAELDGGRRGGTLCCRGGNGRETTATMLHRRGIAAGGGRDVHAAVQSDGADDREDGEVAAAAR